MYYSLEHVELHVCNVYSYSSTYYTNAYNYNNMYMYNHVHVCGMYSLPAPATTVDIVRLLLSCLHAWSLDDDLDESCEDVLGLVRPSRPVSFGLLSKGQCLSLVLPGQLFLHPLK